jgi:hypothetical protein
MTSHPFSKSMVSKEARWTPRGTNASTYGSGVVPWLRQVRVGVTRSGKKGKTVTVIDGLDPGGGVEEAKVGARGSGFKVQGIEFKGSEGFRVSGSGSRVYDQGSRV